MATLFILRVPEFSRLREAAARRSEFTVAECGNYTRVSAPAELRLTRAETGLGKAVWYGALTGGYVGDIEQFDDDELRIRS